MRIQKLVIYNFNALKDNLNHLFNVIISSD